MHQNANVLASCKRVQSKWLSAINAPITDQDAFNSRVNIKALVGIVKPSNLSCGIVVENKPCGIRAGPYLHWVAIRQPTNIKTQLGIRCHMYLPNPAPFFSCSCLCGSISEANRTWSYCSCINSSWSRPDQACSGWLELNAFTAG